MVLTPEKIDAGIIDVPDEQRIRLLRLLHIDWKPDKDELYERSGKVVFLVRDIPHKIHERGILVGGMNHFGLAHYLIRRFKVWDYDVYIEHWNDTSQLIKL